MKKLQSACLPMPGTSGHCGQCPPQTKVMVCLPCLPPICQESKKKEKKKPVGLITPCKEANLIADRFVGQCTCGKRNGLGPDECPRISCINNPGCWAKPFPLCWQFKEEPEPIPNQEMMAEHQQQDSYPFAVPKFTCADEEPPSKGPKSARYLPPPSRRICPPHCIHWKDLKGERPCLLHEGKPCRADCFATNNIGKGHY